MMQAVEASLKRLQTDYIDRMVHIWDAIHREESCADSTISFARKDFCTWHLGRSRLVGRPGKYSGGDRSWTQFIGLQLEYSLIERTVERELIPMAKALNWGFWLSLPWRVDF